MPKLKKIALVKCKEADVIPDKTGILRRFFKITRAFKPQYLILTTFHLDMQFLQDEVLSQIPSSCKTLIFYSPFSRNSNTTNARGCSRIRFIKARTRVFHPKFILAMAGPHLLIGIGSGNLTTGGWGGKNQELFHFYADHNLIAQKGGGFGKVQQLTKSVQDGCIDYLKKLQSHEIQKERRHDLETTKRIVDRIRGVACTMQHRTNRNIIIHNYDQSFFDYIKMRFKKQIKELHIFSPIHFKAYPSEDEGLSDQSNPRIGYDLFGHFTRLISRNGKATIKFYSSDGVPETMINRLKVKGVEFYENRSWPSHLKALVVKTPGKAYMISGSANFTIPAILKRCVKNGNSELMHVMDITDQWPELRERIIGKGKLRRQTGVVSNGEVVTGDRGSPVIDQMEVIKAGDGTYYCKIFSSLPKGKKIALSIRYERFGQQADGVKPMKLVVRGLKNSFKVKSNSIWYRQLIQDQPLFCWYEVKGRRYFFPANYNYDNYTEDMLTEDEKQYEELLDHFGCSMRKRRGRKGTQDNIIIEPPDNDKNGQDDKEAENQYQSSTDQFYHVWKHICRRLAEYKRKHDNYRYEFGKEEIQKYIVSEDAKKRLTDIQMKFVRDYVLEMV